MLIAEEYKGFWFLPHQEKVRFAGTLTYGPDQPVRLSVTGAADQEIITTFTQRKEFHIWGITLQGEPVTLFDCNRITISYPLAGIQSAVYNAQYIIIGSHVEERDSRIVKGVRISFDHLEDWMGIYGYEVEPSATLNSFKVTFERPADIPFTLDENTSGALTFWNNFPYGYEAKMVLEQQNLVKLDFLQPISVTELSPVTWRLHRFFTLMTQVKVRIKWYYIYSEQSRLTEDESTIYPGLKELKIFYQQGELRFEEDAGRHFLLRFEDLRPNFEKVLQNWFRIESELVSVLDVLYNNTGPAVDGYLHTRFLELTQAVEAYHRRKLQNTGKLKAEAKLIEDRIMTFQPEGTDKEWLVKKLEYAYEPSLVKRLKRLYALNKHILFGDTKGKSAQLDRLIGSIAAKRNGLTHNDGSTQIAFDDILNVYNYAEMMKVILIISILRELVISEDLITEAVRRKHHFRLG